MSAVSLLGVGGGGIVNPVSRLAQSVGIL